MQTYKKILLVQFRTDASEEHEVHCFRDAAHLHHEQLNTANAIKEHLEPSVVDGYDAVILGGSGEMFLSQGDSGAPWVSRAIDVVNYALEKDIPMLGVCFGYQLLAITQGASVVRNDERMETGTFEISQLPVYDKDPLFKNVPDTFEAQLGHKDSLMNLNGTVDYLAESDSVFPQAFRIKGKRAWGILFHLELNNERMMDRMVMFPGYLSEGQDPKKLFKDTPHAEKILHNFMDVVNESSAN